MNSSIGTYVRKLKLTSTLLGVCGAVAPPMGIKPIGERESAACIGEAFLVWLCRASATEL